MAARPELILLQKNMALVEGVGRMLDPEMDIWSISEPVVGNWIRQKAGPKGRMQDMTGQIAELFRSARKIPEMVERADSILRDHEEEMRRQRQNGGRGTRMVIMVVIILLSLLLWRAW